MRLRYKVHVDDVRIDKGNYAKYGLVVSVWDNNEEVKEVKVYKRYSEFRQLKKSLESQIGGDLPYEFPPRTALLWGISNGVNEDVIDERKIKLPQFMEELLNDSFDVRWKRSPLVSSFLGVDLRQLEASHGHGSGGGAEKSSLVSHRFEEINRDNWISMFQDCKMEFEDCKKNLSGSARSKRAMQIRLKVNGLDSSLKTEKELPSEESIRRSKLLQNLKEDLNDLVLEMDSSNLYGSFANNAASEPSQPVKPLPGRRRLGETDETAKYNNKGLLQAQQTIVKDQDQELAQLHKVIQRQKQISLDMNDELILQNELLDSFETDVDRTANKLKKANRKARDFNS
ncbi:Vacuolar morphogenesis protein 7 [Nakaseomyces bracarensis]|uniref:Vacuolar morphogenesis protein 7 n=1 Tax=Nakaseomyces bracarensis TaxID=273131 RepID=A0ABR4P043_9SACH